ncbi:uncharacterized protein LOC144120160 [Amblyomma americanum]
MWPTDCQRSNRSVFKGPGVYLDWSHPGDACGNPSDGDNLVDFIRKLKDVNISVVLAVPPVLGLLRFYELPRTLPLLDYLVVKTHTLRLSGVVHCSGAREHAARVFGDIRRSVPLHHWDKLAYSISVAADTFTARYASLGTVSSGPSSWDTTTRQPAKTHYAAVCQTNVTRSSQHPECAIAHAIDSQGFKVATFSGPEELRTRIRNSYNDGMGDVPIVVYDIDLDDFEGSCPGGDMSPLIHTLAVSTHNS